MIIMRRGLKSMKAFRRYSICGSEQPLDFEGQGLESRCGALYASVST